MPEALRLNAKQLRLQNESARIPRGLDASKHHLEATETKGRDDLKRALVAFIWRQKEKFAKDYGNRGGELMKNHEVRDVRAYGRRLRQKSREELRGRLVRESVPDRAGVDPAQTSTLPTRQALQLYFLHQKFWFRAFLCEFSFGPYTKYAGMPRMPAHVRLTWGYFDRCWSYP